MLEKIVVGYARDQSAADAVKLAATLAAELRSQITVAFPYHPLLSGYTTDAAERRVRDAVEPMLADSSLAVAPTYRSTSSSWPIHALHDVARDEHAELIVVGSARGRWPLDQHVSLMERMVHGAPCAVAVAPPGYADTPVAQLRRVGVGFSASEEGRAALTLANDLARLGAGRLEVIAAVGLEPALASYAFSSPALPDLIEELYAETQAAVDQLTGQLDPQVPISRTTRKGDAVGVLLESARDLNLLVLGSRAYGPLRHALLGSVSARVMREAACPVLVVPRGIAHSDVEAATDAGVVEVARAEARAASAATGRPTADT